MTPAATLLLILTLLALLDLAALRWGVTSRAIADRRSDW